MKMHKFLGAILIGIHSLSLYSAGQEIPEKINVGRAPSAFRPLSSVVPPLEQTVYPHLMPVSLGSPVAPTLEDVAAALLPPPH